MSLSDLYASTIVKVRVSFGFSEFSCSPTEISARLGIEPDAVRVRGERRALRGNPNFVVPFSSWHVTSRCESKDVNEQLRDLLARLEGAQRSFSPEWGQPAFDVLWMGNYLYAGSGPFYEADVVAGIAALGAALYQDIYQVDRDEDESSSVREP